MLSSARLCKLDEKGVEVSQGRQNRLKDQYFKFFSVKAYCLIPQLFLSRSSFSGVKNTIKAVYISDSDSLLESDLLSLFSSENLKSLSIVNCENCSPTAMLELLEQDPPIINCRLVGLRMELNRYSSFKYDEEKKEEFPGDSDCGGLEVIVTDESSSLAWGLSLKLLSHIFIAINPLFKLLSERCGCNRMMSVTGVKSMSAEYEAVTLKVSSASLARPS
jgi:hypothetical protein